jgi:hypothetical protein
MYGRPVDFFFAGPSLAHGRLVKTRSGFGGGGALSLP